MHTTHVPSTNLTAYLEVGTSIEAKIIFSEARFFVPFYDILLNTKMVLPFDPPAPSDNSYPSPRSLRPCLLACLPTIPLPFNSSIPPSLPPYLPFSLRPSDPFFPQIPPSDSPFNPSFTHALLPIYLQFWNT